MRRRRPPPPAPRRSNHRTSPASPHCLGRWRRPRTERQHGDPGRYAGRGGCRGPITIKGSKLPPNADVELTWSTADATWLVQTAPDTVNYLGRSDTLFDVVLDTTTTNAQGTFAVSLKAPTDWGGVHDIYAVINGTQEAHGGFIELRTVTVSPTSGPVGTPITITYSGLGSSLYEGGASLLYDNHYVGELMANWTRGTAQVTIRATGAVGMHSSRSATPSRSCT